MLIAIWILAFYFLRHHYRIRRHIVDIEYFLGGAGAQQYDARGHNSEEMLFHNLLFLVFYNICVA